MADFNKFYTFVDDVLKAKHDLGGGDALSIYLTNTAPDASAHSVKADLDEIPLGNGYDGPQDINKLYTASSGTARIVGDEVLIEASGGSIGPFRYVVLINDSHPDKPLIGWWDFEESIIVEVGEAFRWQPSGSPTGGTVFTLS